MNGIFKVASVTAGSGYVHLQLVEDREPTEVPKLEDPEVEKLADQMVAMLRKEMGISKEDVEEAKNMAKIVISHMLGMGVPIVPVGSRRPMDMLTTASVHLTRKEWEELGRPEPGRKLKLFLETRVDADPDKPEPGAYFET